MEKKIEKVLALAGNEHRYQYFTLFVITFLWINCNFSSCVLPFIEREPIINYTDSEGVFQEKITLTNDICSELNGKDFQVVESFGYSWVSEFHIECKTADISNIGSFAYIGNSIGVLIFSFVSKLISHKKIIIISCMGFCVTTFLCTLVKSYKYFYGLLACEIFMGLFGNCLCYSSLVIVQEIVSNKRRSIFSSIVNIGYALCGIIYAILFLLFKNWRNVYYVLIGATVLVLILIWIFIYDSPREYLNNNNYKKALKILAGIAAFNGKLEEFKEIIKQDMYQEIIKGKKNEIILIEGERSTKLKKNEKRKKNDEINSNSKTSNRMNHESGGN